MRSDILLLYVGVVKKVVRALGIARGMRGVQTEQTRLKFRGQHSKVTTRFGTKRI
jgi:hypothetical protein